MCGPEPHQVLDGGADERGMRKTASQHWSDLRTGAGRRPEHTIAKVEQLRRLVEVGGYHPDPRRIAEAMVSYARRSMLARPLDGPPSA